MAQRQARALDKKGSSKDAPTTRSGKFFDEGDVPPFQKFQYGGLDCFFTGLDGFIGPPHPSLRATMEHEHCGSADSKDDFTVSCPATRILLYLIITFDLIIELPSDAHTFIPYDHFLTLSLSCSATRILLYLMIIF